jgi:formyltetrahydrofolate deformylase
VSESYILTISCEDKVGIVSAVAGFLSSQQYFIEESSHFGDRSTGYFFMRTRFTALDSRVFDVFSTSFSQVAQSLRLSWQLHPVSERPKVLILASRQDHCVRDLLYRSQSGSLDMEVVGVISNHRDVEEICCWYQVPFHYNPLEKGNKSVSESRITEIYQRSEAELMVLARYMQILSSAFCGIHEGHIINIHHSFLPSFKGAKPYHQAFDNGVKLIGATAHYVTADLDEGPIIEQEVVRVNHACSVNDLVSLGRDVEAQTLAKAVQYHLERRVFIDKSKTVVFRK